MSVWGPLAARYETERPRKLLALDGGGELYERLDAGGADVRRDHNIGQHRA